MKVFSQPGDALITVFADCSILSQRVLKLHLSVVFNLDSKVGSLVDPK
jgi:hypothetical protein